MNQPEQNDPLDALLREQNPYVEDNGFTARVIAVLPRRRQHAWWRPTLLLGSGVIGAVLAVQWLPWQNLPVPNPTTLLSLNTQALLPWVAVLSVSAALAWVTMAAVWSED